MYLKSMEIQGFKSFAGKTTLEFKDGITGIVGPNGSGKSNIADALRWVLGEQKVKSLRGAKMEDIIFAGTQKRNPLSFAYVAITFDNSQRELALDYTEVKVARKLYRSGESEYLLNGQPVRLKDIRELFYDTGIGKEGYSIIGQGEIDRILQGKSEDRRELFDEACGIVKYKKRKTLALRRLENERLNLERVNDIISELEKRLAPLKKQSDTANRFVSLKNALKELDINLFLFESGELKKKINECAQKEKNALKELEENKKELERIKTGHGEAAARLSQIEAEIEKTGKEISRADIVKENLAGQINVLNEQINSAQSSKEHYTQRKEELLSSIKIAEKEKALEEAKQHETEEALKELEYRKAQTAAGLIEISNEIARREEEVQGLKEALIENVREKGETDARAERLRANKEQSAQKRSQLEDALKSYSDEKQRQKEKSERLSRELALQEQKVVSFEEAVNEQKAALNKLEREAELMNTQLSSLKLEEARAQTRLESIRNITERYEGYSGAIREVMALKKKKKGILGVVADIIRVPKEYEVAIETALGGNIQNIVTDNENTAREAIEYLKEGRLGRATFLPLQAVKARGSFRYEEALFEKGSLGPANTLVSTDGEYLDLCEYLLGRILVVDTIDNALKIARKYRYSFIMVTLEGELLSRGGAISGGAYKNKSSLLGRRREIDELEKEISSCEEKMRETSSKLAALFKERDTCNIQLKSLTDSLQDEKLILNTLRLNLSRSADEGKRLSRDFESARELSRKADELEKSLEASENEIAKALAENAQANENIKKTITSLEKELHELKEDEQERSRVNAGIDIEISRSKEKLSFAVNSIIKAENNTAALRGDLKALETAVLKSSVRVNECLDEIEQAREASQRAAQEAALLSVKLGGLEDKRQEARDQGGDFLRLNEELTRNISDLDKEIFRLDELIEKYENLYNSKADYIWNEYGLTYNSSLAFRFKKSIPPGEMKESINKLRAEIKGLGTINVSAIEEYSQVSERHSFLCGQRDDIVKAENDILKIIKDLDRKMKERFETEFSKISGEFSKVFKIMFGGGSGSIRLENEADILESDIEITAQPPGKKLQNMMQLSGGEKALTAIAVLFAIQNLKPSPFCILDEIEAALDDANILKFTNYLTLLSGRIQFIVITHRKGTMLSCNRLYGITMPEKGVSSVVSVSLEEAGKNAYEDAK